MWHYTAPKGAPRDGAYRAVSYDGIDFVRVDDIVSVGDVNWTGNLVEHGHGMRFYGGSARSLWWAESEDGRAWSDPRAIGVRGGDPAVVETFDGAVLLIAVG